MWRAIPGIIFLLIVAVLLYSTYMGSTKDSGAELIGQTVPNLHGNQITGYKYPPPASILFKHQYVLVNFFASWCTPCLAEHPYLNQLSKNYDIKIVGIAWRDSADNITNMLTEHGNPYDYVAIDKMDASAFGFGVAGLPESFLVGHDGKIISHHRGPLLPATIAEKITPYLTK